MIDVAQKTIELIDDIIYMIPFAQLVLCGRLLLHPPTAKSCRRLRHLARRCFASTSRTAFESTILNSLACYRPIAAIFETLDALVGFRLGVSVMMAASFVYPIFRILKTCGVGNHRFPMRLTHCILIFWL